MMRQAPAAGLLGEALPSSRRLARHSPEPPLAQAGPQQPLWQDWIERLSECLTMWARTLPAPVDNRKESQWRELTARVLDDLRLLKTLMAHDAIGASPLSKPAPEKIHLFMTEHLDQELTLQHLADFLGYSSKYCSDYFRAQMGESFSHYLANLRLNKAKELLRSTDLPIAHIADAVGFSDQYAFSHFFKRRLGFPPTEFRRRLRGRPTQCERPATGSSCRRKTVA